MRRSLTAAPHSTREGLIACAVADAGKAQSRNVSNKERAGILIRRVFMALPQGDRNGSSGSCVGLIESTSMRGTTWPSVEGKLTVPMTSNHSLSFQVPATLPPSSTEAGCASAAQHHMIQ